MTLTIANINLDNSNNLRFAGGLTNDTTITMSDNGSGSATLQLTGSSQTIGGNGEIQFTTADTNTINTNNFAHLLTFGSGQTVRATAGSNGSIGVDSVNNGQLIAEAGSTITLTRSFNNAGGGIIGGSGTITATSFGIVNNSVISPGMSPGTLTVNGNINSSNDSTLFIEIAGGGAGEFDLLNVSGSFDVDGELEVAFLQGAEFLNFSDAITIVNAGSLLNTTPTTGFDTITSDGGGNFDVFYDSGLGTITLTNFANIPNANVVTGDMNGDGALTKSDISAFVLALTDAPAYAAAYPGLSPNLRGDFTGNKKLNNGDIDGFVAALSNLGVNASVPEPATAALLFAGLGLLGRRRRTA